MDYRYYYERPERDERPVRPRLRLAAAASIVTSAAVLLVGGIGSSGGQVAGLFAMAVLVPLVFDVPLARLADRVRAGASSFAAG